MRVSPPRRDRAYGRDDNRVLGACVFQFFYLISDLYKEGNAKDMRRWAYEIHSTFLVPDAVSMAPI